MQRVSKLKCTKNETFDGNIFMTSRFSDRNILLPIRTTSENKELSRENKEFETILPLHFFTNYW